jgi:hypothetical protein
MNASTRRTLALLLAGAMAAIVALAVTSTIRRDACLDAGGRWRAEGGCELTGGALPGPAGAYVAGVLAGGLVLVFVWRVYTFFAARGARSPSS